MFEIRRMLAEDFLQVYLLGQSCFDTWEIPYQAWTIREVAYHFEIENEHCFVTTDNGKVIGFSLGAETYDVMSDTGQIEWTAVHPNYQGMGLGEKLFNANYNSLVEKGKRRVVTDVSLTNYSAQRMVEKAGFSIVATVNFWIKNAGAGLLESSQDKSNE